jgi:hypothetical protein
VVFKLRRMEGAWLARMRWRRRGAWLAPALVVATVADAIIGHLLPPAGESQTLFAAALLGAVFNLLALLLLRVPISAMVRRRRPDLPRVVSRDYAGTVAVAFVSAALLLVGVLHRPTIIANRNAMNDAITRAQAWIGVHAPAEFRRNLTRVSTYVIEPGRIYRTCVPSASSRRTYCVVVKSQMPFAQSVTFAGYESNADFSRGAW